MRKLADFKLPTLSISTVCNLLIINIPAFDSKSGVPQGTGGSNPSPSANLWARREGHPG
jgi:hypothetical protein